MITVLSSTVNALQFKVSETSGVYFLKRAGELIYIGKSVNVFSRIFGADHCDKGFDDCTKRKAPRYTLLRQKL